MAKQEEQQSASEVAGPKTTLRRVAPLLALALAAVVVLALDLDEHLSFESLRDNRTQLAEYVGAHFLFATVLFVAVYAASTALSLPGGAFLSIAGGFLFGPLSGTLAIVVGATIGALLVFLVARSAFGPSLRNRAGPFLKKMEAGFQENALSYLLVLRLIPLFPFFVVNLVPAFLGVSLKTYVVGTFIGIIPGSAVFAVAGAGLDSILARGEPFSAATVLTPEVIAALVGLSLLALLPVAYKRFKKAAA